jgi:pentatricopeptide repeat protein
VKIAGLAIADHRKHASRTEDRGPLARGALLIAACRLVSRMRRSGIVPDCLDSGGIESVASAGIVRKVSFELRGTTRASIRRPSPGRRACSGP